MEDAVVGSKVFDTDLEGREWRAERCQRGIHPLGIVGTRLHQYIEVLGGTRVAMERDRVAAQHHKASPGPVKLDEDIPKVVEKLNHARVRGTKRTAMPSRECRAFSRRTRLKLSIVSCVASEIAAAPLTGVKSTSRWPS